jgi:hypothetical protein
MPWKESSVMEERLRFVARLLEGEAMTDVCRDFGISRKTGYKVGARGRACTSGVQVDREVPVKFRRPAGPLHKTCRADNAYDECSPYALW